MKLSYSLAITVICVCLVSITNATDLNGRINIINNDGTNYKVKLQINTDSQPGELGGATIILNYDNIILSFPDTPEMGIDFIFYNFNGGYYDEAKITKVTDSQIWINVDLISDDYGTIVTGGPYQWTDLVLLNFESNTIVTSNVISWNIYNPYWGVYDSNNSTTWGLGNFDNITTSTESEILDTELNTYILYQNYPNPFNPSTKISWNSLTDGWQTLKIYDILGNEVVTLVDEYMPSGKHEVEFSPVNQSTFDMASGVYFYRLQIDSFVDTKKMVLIK